MSAAASGDLLAWLDTAITATTRTSEAAMSFGLRFVGEPDCVYGTGDGGQTEAATKHFALHGPESVLRRCAADRKLLELHGGRGHACPAYDYDGDLDEWARFYNHEVCPVVLSLAEGYGWTEAQR